MWNLTYKPQSFWDFLLWSKVKNRFFFSLVEQNRMHGWVSQGPGKRSWMCLINNGNSSRAKDARKIYPKLLEINLRERHSLYNWGCGEEKNLWKWFHFQMWVINGTEDGAERNQDQENRSARTKKNVLFLGLEPKIFLSLVTILTSNAEARNVNPYGAVLAAYYVSILSTEKGEGSPLCVSANRDEKKKITCF